MKLVKCMKCSDGFFLYFDERRCLCGATRGAYEANGVTAWISGPAVSLAIGNGSFHRAVQEMLALRDSTKDTAPREDYIKVAQITHAWVRPNSGPGNPHTREENDGRP